MFERGEILSERHPVQHLGAEQRHAERIALAVADKFLQRLDRLVATPPVAERRRHAAGHIEHELDVRQHALIALAERTLRPGQQHDRHRQQQRRTEVGNLDDALEPSAALRAGVVERHRKSRAAPPPFPNQQQHWQRQQDQHGWKGEGHSGQRYGASRAGMSTVAVPGGRCSQSSRPCSSGPASSCTLSWWCSSATSPSSGRPSRSRQ